MTPSSTGGSDGGQAASAPRRSRAPAPGWIFPFAALAVAFNLGSFIVEYGVIVSHVRLLTELKDRADRLREERYGPAVVPVSSDQVDRSAALKDSPVPLT